MSSQFDPKTGLWVVKTGPTSPLTAQDLKKKRREYIGEGAIPRLKPIGPYDVRNLEQHVRGRADAAAQVVIHLAFLKANRLVNDSEVVSCIGAVYQDAKGETSYPRAHRLPCNPMIGIFTHPELCGFRYSAAAERMKEPLAVTDSLPLLANYADALFEKSGPYQTMTEAVREVLIEQSKDKPVNINLVRHVVSYRILPGFQQAYEEARQKSRKMSEKDFIDVIGKDAAPFSATQFARMEQYSIEMEFDSDAPTQNREGAQDILLMSATTASRYQPRLILPDGINNENECLKSLASGDVMAQGATARE